MVSKESLIKNKCALAYGGGYTTIKTQLKCSEEEAKTILRNYEEGFKGTIEFARKGSKFVRTNGYIIINKTTGHRSWWWDFKEWKDRQVSRDYEFWDTYHKLKEENPECQLVREVKRDLKVAAKYDRLARNLPAQGTSACMTKVAMTNIFNWIVDNGYFGKIHCCVVVHDKCFVVGKLC